MTPQSFEAIVKKHFAFLKSEFGFVDNLKNFGYEKDGLEIEFYHGKGEVDILFFVRKSGAIFKPYISRSFDFLDIVRRLNGGKLPKQENIALSANYLVTAKHLDAYLSYCAELMKSCCVDQLKGDLSILEVIHTSRRKND